MALPVDSLFGAVQSVGGSAVLLASYGNDIVNVDTGLGYGQGLTPGSKGEFSTYLDKVFFVNYNDATRSFDFTTWTTTGRRNRAPKAKYMKVFQSTYGAQAYLANIQIGLQKFPSRVWKSDLPYNNDARWGLEYGTDMAQTATSKVITSASALFKTYGIKAGDPVFFTDGTNAGQYTVDTVDSETQLTLLEVLTNTTSGTTYVVGSNYFDVKTDDNDFIRGIGENGARLLLFKLYSLHKYNGASLLPVTGALGTSSHRSIVNVGAFTLYFHGSETTKTGIYLYNGSDSIKISTAVQPYIDGIAASMYDDVVGWREGDWYRLYVGDITNTQRKLSVKKAVLSINVMQNKWSIDPIAHPVLCTTTFLESNKENILFGDDDAGIFQLNLGYSFGDSPISWAMELGPQYPVGSEVTIRLTRIQIIARDARGVKVSYKRYNIPIKVEDSWRPLGQIEGDKTEFKILADYSECCGLDVRLEETGTKENTLFIEKITIFYIPVYNRSPQ